MVVVLPTVASVYSTALAMIPVAEAFVPVALRRTGGLPRPLPSLADPSTVNDRGLRMSPPTSPESAGSEKKTENSSNIENDNDDHDDDNTILHQRIKQADPEWYREYVSDLLGEEYCTNRWPTIDLSLMGPNDEAEVEKVDETTIPSEKSQDVPGESFVPQPILAEENDKRPVVDNLEEDNGGIGKDDSEVTKAKTDSKVEEDGENNSYGAVVEDEEKKIVLECNKDGEDKSTSSETEDSSSQVVQEAIENQSVVDQIEAIESLSTDTKLASAKKTGQNDDEIAVGAKSQPIRESLGDVRREDSRAVVYRNITGQAMTCVPLVDLLELGYTVSDVERIQAEFLSIVVLDRRRCPSMGVPPQWKVKNPRAVGETTLVGSMKEATALVNQINQEERAKRDSTSQRRRRQELRQRGSKDQRRDGPPTDTSGEDGIDADGLRRSRRDRIVDRGGRRSEARRRPGRGAPGRPPDDYGEPRQRRRSENREDEAPLPGRDRRRRLRDGDYDGTPRKIYRVPRDDTRRRNNDEPDPPDPNSPIWVNMDTFRDLLQKEADFRLNILGDDWSDIIDEENDWRTGLYRSWLWSLNNGLGESIVPPSRYERARRRQMRRNPQEPPRARPRTRPSQQSSSSGERRRRQMGVGPPSLETRQPPRDGETRPRRQRRPRRDARDVPGTEDNDDDDDDNNADVPVGDAQNSAARRRLRRRAERRLRTPPDS